MADSLIGAVQESSLGQGTKDILTTVLSNIDTTNTAASVTDVGGTSLVQGNTTDGQFVSALVPSTSPVNGTVNSGNFVADVALPVGTGLLLQGLADTTNASGAETYFNTLINSSLPSTSTDSAVIDQRTSLQNAASIVTNGSGDGQNVTVRLVNIIDNTSHSGTGEVVINGQGSGSLTNIVAVNTTGLSSNQTLVLENIPRSVIVGSGSVELRGNTGSLVIGDNANQRIVGGTGADTLVGGGGSDTLVGGGGGNNLFGFNSVGHYTVTDFTPSSDRLAFSIPGVTNISQLASLVTSVDTSGDSTTYNFGPAASITLTGVSSNQVLSDMIQFTITPGS
jgi:Ca2+-binding RTX toxin-like protein